MLTVQQLLEPHPRGLVWPSCGHPRTEGNAQFVGGGRQQCRICRRKIAHRYFLRHTPADTPDDRADQFADRDRLIDHCGWVDVPNDPSRGGTVRAFNDGE
jgi:hypothetical protein